MKLIVGLGNPGRLYKYSRHNIGFLVIDRLAKEWNIKIKPYVSIRSAIGKGILENIEVILAKPLCFMNLSGQTVSLLFERYNLNLQDMLVVFDDLDLSWGKIRIRPKGSSGGHKGMESIINTLGSSEFARLRFGIDRPRHKLGVINYVLSKWTKEEERELNRCLEQAADCCRTWIIAGITQTMDKFNSHL